MRILIIAVERSGGFQLTKWISWEMGCKPIHEPIMTPQSVEGENVVVKYLVGEIKDNKDIDLTNWDKIIGLVRMDTYDSAISQTRCLERNKWHEPYELREQWIQNNLELINENEKVIKSNINYLRSIKEIQLFTTYDGIYHSKEDIQRIKDYIGIKNTKYEYLLDNKNRLRKKNKLI
jgi:hypothetical protein